MSIKLPIIENDNKKKVISDDYPLLSVVAVCYNHENFVVETLDSILSQGYFNIEVIIVDDFSSDSSVQVISEWIEKTVTECVFVKHDSNEGICFSLNEAIELCKGEYIKIISCDDVLVDGSLGNQVEILEDSSSNVAMVCGNVIEIDEYGNELGEYFPESYQFPQNVFKALFSGHDGRPIVVHTPTVLIKRSVYDDVGSYPDDIIQEDFYMWTIIASKYEIIFINDIYVKYRVLSSSLSKNERYRLRILLCRLQVCEKLYQLIDDIEILQVILSEKIKITRNIVLIYLYQNNTIECDHYFNEFIKLVRVNDGYQVENLLKTISKYNVKFSYQLLNKYDLKIRSYLLRVHIFLRMPIFYYVDCFSSFFK